jgi:hypothetical protein
MGSTTVANIANVLKNLWPQSRVENEVYPDHPFLSRITKDENFVGEDIKLVVRIGDGQGRNVVLATAQTNASAPQYRRFALTRSKNYQVFQIDGEAIEAARNDTGSLVRTLDDEIKGSINNITKDLAVNLFRGRGGNLSQIGAVAAGPPATITLSNVADITSFEVGMILVAATTVGSVANRSTPASAAITGVNRSTGVLTFANGTFAGTNWAANDYLFVAGDRDSVTGVGQKMLGLADWLPVTDPTGGESFLGVDRSIDRTRLAGIPLDISSYIPEEGALYVVMECDRNGARPKDFVVNHTDYQSVLNSLGSKAVTKYEGTGQVGFQTIQINGPKGPVSMYLDQDCPAGVGYCLDMRFWKLYSLGPAPKMLEQDGLPILRLATTDAYEGRMGYYANLGTTAPGFNAVVTMPSS